MITERFAATSPRDHPRAHGHRGGQGVRRHTGDVQRPSAPTRSWPPARSSTATTRSWATTGPRERPSPTSVTTTARFHVSDDAVIVEFDLLGTNLGEFYGLPPTGKAFRVPIIAVFFFEGDRIVNERIYFDSASLVTQIGRGELLALAASGDA